MIKTLNVGEPIDYPVINAMITRMNQLDAADRLTGMAWDTAKTKYTTSKDNIAFQAFRVRRKTTNKESDYTAAIGTVNYPQAFAAPPIVVVTPQDGGQFLVPYIDRVTAAGFVLSVARLSKSWADAPTACTLNVVAFGPAKIN